MCAFHLISFPSVTTGRPITRARRRQNGAAHASTAPTSEHPRKLAHATRTLTRPHHCSQPLARTRTDARTARSGPTRSPLSSPVLMDRARSASLSDNGAMHSRSSGNGLGRAGGHADQQEDLDMWQHNGQPREHACKRDHARNGNGTRIHLSAVCCAVLSLSHSRSLAARSLSQASCRTTQRIRTSIPSLPASWSTCTDIRSSPHRSSSRSSTRR